MLGVWWCFVFLASSCFMAAKAFGPVWGLCYPLHHGACVVVVLCTPAQRYSSYDDPGPPLDAAKLHIRHSLQHVWHTPLLSSSAFPAPSLPAPFLLCFCVLWFLAFSFLSCNFPCLHLGERSLELRLLRECFLVCLLRWLMLLVRQGKSCAY